MALLAGLREARRHMVRIGRALIILHVTCNAGRAAQVKTVVEMTIRALPRGNGVAAAEGKSYRAVIERRTEPCVRAMAVIAGRGEFRTAVIGIERGLEIFGVAGIALRRHRLELTRRRALMA